MAQTLCELRKKSGAGGGSVDNFQILVPLVTTYVYIPMSWFRDNGFKKIKGSDDTNCNFCFTDTAPYSTLHDAWTLAKTSGYTFSDTQLNYNYIMFYNSTNSVVTFTFYK